jgi:hypothetical protein
MANAATEYTIQDLTLVIEQLTDLTDDQHLMSQYKKCFETSKADVYGVFMLGYMLGSTQNINDDQIASSIVERGQQLYQQEKWKKFCRLFTKIIGSVTLNQMDLPRNMDELVSFIHQENQYVFRELPLLEYYQVLNWSTDDFISNYKTTLNKVNSSIRESPLLKMILELPNTDQWLNESCPVYSPAIKPSMKNIYSPINHNKHFLSFDIVKGNATVFLYLLPSLFGMNGLSDIFNLDELKEELEGEHRWTTFMRFITDNELFINSKIFRQIGISQGHSLHVVNIATGCTVKGRNIEALVQKGEKHLIGLALIQLEQMFPLVCYFNDEIIFEVDPLEVDYNMINERLSVLPDWLQQNLRIEVFKLINLKGPNINAYVKEIMDPDQNIVKREFKNTSPKHYAEINSLYTSN